VTRSKIFNAGILDSGAGVFGDDVINCTVLRPGGKVWLDTGLVFIL